MMSTAPGGADGRGRNAALTIAALVGIGAATLTSCGGGDATTGGTGSGGTAPGSGGAAGPGSGGTGPGTGGAGLASTGGATAATGGAAAATGGAAAGIGGGSSATGGAGPSGGATGSGGAAATGGRTGTAGNVGTGGAASGGVAGTTTGSGGAGGSAGPAIVDLFNGTDLTGWTAYRESTAGGQTAGTMLTAAQALQIFKVENGTIRVYGDSADQSTQARHTLVTARSYSKYNFWFEYRWGTKTFAPYGDVTRYPRDAGLLWHLHGNLSQVWPASIELQAKQGTTGDIFALYARCTSLASGGGTTFVEGGTSKLVDGSNGFTQHGRSANFELPDWNQLEIQVGVSATGGSSAVYLVNGHIVNRVTNVMDKTGKDVTSGPLALQAEHAEVFYRNIRVQVLP